MSYMAKKTQKRQTTIISLSDSNQQELENIKKQREQMLKEYQDKKQGKVLFYISSKKNISDNIKLHRLADQWITHKNVCVKFVFAQFTFHSFDELRWTQQICLLNWLEHCSANAEVMDSNPTEVPKIFFGLI